MTFAGVSRGLVASIFWTAFASAQTAPTAAKIEAVPLELTMPERYQVNEVLEPIRKVTLVAPRDGLIRTIEARLGSVVRESEELAQLDRTEAAARLKIATAELHEKQALLKSNRNDSGVYQAQVDAAQGRVELAQLDLDRCTLRAPFSGRIVAVPVCTGQYVLKGAVIVELADVSSLRVMQPVDRRSVAANASLSVQVEGRDVPAKVQAVLPLPESLKVLRELSTPLSAAMLVVANSKGELEPGQRVQSGTVPTTPTTTVPKRAVKPEDPRGGDNMIVQVIRDDYVTNVPVRVLGETGAERVQIAGALRTSDSLITSSSVPLLAGTLVRFGDTAAPANATNAEPGAVAPGSGRSRTPAPSSRGQRPAARNTGASSPF